jgi:hypothetical protein
MSILEFAPFSKHREKAGVRASETVGKRFLLLFAGLLFKSYSPEKDFVPEFLVGRTTGFDFGRRSICLFLIDPHHFNRFRALLPLYADACAFFSAVILLIASIRPAVPKMLITRVKL